MVFKPLCFTIWPRFAPGIQGWRHSSAEMLFMLTEGGSSGKGRIDEMEENIRTQIRRRSKLNLEDLKPTFV